MSEKKSYTSLSVESDLAAEIAKESNKNKKTITAQIRSWKDLANAVRSGVN